MNGAIKREDMIKYESIRRSGRFNMIMDSKIVMSILWPNKSEREALPLYSFLQQNYSDLMDMYFLDENFNYPKFEYTETINYSFE